MALRQNLASNPALKIDATGWTGPSGWVRNASGAALLAATGRVQCFEGVTGGAPIDVLAPRAAVVAGQQYYWAVSVRAIEDQSANMLVNFYSGVAAGSSFIANSGATVPLNLVAGDVNRFVLGPYTVPAGAAAGALKLNDLDGNAEVTAYQVELSSTWDGTYFDGDSPGASWDGADGLSSSSIRQATETVAVADSFGIAVTAAGPVATETVAGSEAFGIGASGGLNEAVAVADSFLIASLAYRSDIGRVRIEAFTFTSAVVRVRVSRRPVSGGAWTVVRGGEIDADSTGRMVRPVDDYEYLLGVDVDYRVEGLDLTGVVLQTATLRRTGVGDRAWFKVAGNPALNRELLLLDWTPLRRKSRTGLFDVQGRSDPVVVSDVHSSRTTTLKLAAHTPEERDALDAALRRGVPMLLQVPPDIPLPTMWVTIGDYDMDKPTHRSRRSIFTVPVTEVSAPPASTFVGSYLTWQSIGASYPTWTDLGAAFTTWAELS